NVSGVSAVDQPRAMHLCDLALDFAHRVLRPGGGFAVKVFQGEGFDDFVREVRGGFARVVIRKPRASRPKSREVYVVAGNYNP
ncbi:MAG: 23S rRNA methyltransferase, partial [Candidatus Sedimenticola endophacoides]